MTTVPTKRDYSLLGRDAEAAVASGLAAAEWYHTEIPRKQMKELMKREDGPAIRDTAIWLGSLVLLGGFGIYFWGSLWAVPFFLAYGVLYGSASDSRWHGQPLIGLRSCLLGRFLRPKSTLKLAGALFVLCIRALSYRGPSFNPCVV